ncbi:MAG: primosomal protein N', partial [Mahellales bacterium]
QAVQCIIPPGVGQVSFKRRKEIALVNGDMTMGAYKEVIGPRARTQLKMVELLLKHGPLERNILLKTARASDGPLRELINKNIVKVIYKHEERTPDMEILKGYEQVHTLTPDQSAAVDRIAQALENRRGRFLIHGVTGSGKTEIYMALIKKALDMGLQSIVLVPEISLTSQILSRFKARFGSQVTVLHSRLSAGERFDQWHRIARGDVKVVLGPRSAVFAPFRSLGLIIMDEEHEASYKSSDLSPKYHTREVAMMRCKLEGGVLVLGSATPAVETYYHARQGRYTLISIKKRVNNIKMPEVSLVDMREELLSGNKTIFSRPLFHGIKDILDNGEQAMLFLNRRGFSTFVSCRACGFILKCPDCDIALTYHTDGTLKCHYCGYTRPSPRLCPECRRNYIKYFGIGTQRVEQELKKYFPRCRILRMDVDTTAAKGAHGKILKAFSQGRADILIGTQMIAKGLDFPNITLVGVISADTMLNLPDFRSSERTFQLITQVAGRAGRGDKAGRVIVQTYQPEHFSLAASMHHDYNTFYDKEILIRKQFGYPPFNEIVRILFTGEDQDMVIQAGKDVYQRIHGFGVKGHGRSQCLNLTPAPLPRIRKRHRWQIIIKTKEFSKLKQPINDIIKEIQKRYQYKGVAISVDRDPTNLL